MITAVMCSSPLLARLLDFYIRKEGLPINVYQDYWFIRTVKKHDLIGIYHASFDWLIAPTMAKKNMQTVPPSRLTTPSLGQRNT
jgi:hypothetical protein